MQQRLSLAVVGAVATLAVGYAMPRWWISTGLARFAADPQMATVARAAYDGVWTLNDNPLGRLAFPGARVHRVWRDPGHCSPTEPGGREPTADYRAEAQAYSWFGIPGPRVEVTCGGWSYGLPAQGT